jgi:hypothetical protein
MPGPDLQVYCGFHAWSFNSNLEPADNRKTRVRCKCAARRTEAILKPGFSVARDREDRAGAIKNYYGA